MDKKLALDEVNKMFLGVIAGFAVYLAVDVTVLRLGFVALVLCTGLFPGVLFYFIAWLFMREAV